MMSANDGIEIQTFCIQEQHWLLNRKPIWEVQNFKKGSDNPQNTKLKSEYKEERWMDKSISCPRMGTWVQISASHVCEWEWRWRSEVRGVKSSGAEVSGTCKLADMDGRNQPELRPSGKGTTAPECWAILQLHQLSSSRDFIRSFWSQQSYWRNIF